MQVISQDKEKRLEYEAREKAIRDHNQSILEAEERGREVGEKIGREVGEKIGRAAGEDRISALNRILISKGQYSELARASEDKAYRDKLLQQYGI